MLVGVPKEIKTPEYRVGLPPASTREYATAGHSVLVERGAGAGIGADDQAYRKAGARIADSADQLFVEAEPVAKSLGLPFRPAEEALAA